MTDFLPGTAVEARGLYWEVVESQPLGSQTRLRLRGSDGLFRGLEFDLLTPFETVLPLSQEFHPAKAGRLAEWLVYHQAFLLEQALGPDALLAVQPGRLRIEPYQLVPLVRALRMSRPRLLLADDVGLGKTIQAGLVMAELMARRRAHRLLIVTPAGPLLEQWQREMLERFGLRLEEANRDQLDRIRKSNELGANPFEFIPLAIASMDFLKQDSVLDLLERTSYDLVVMDEAHHYSETGGDDAMSDRLDTSQRRKLALTLARRSDALLLLSATPHDGYERSFASLVELLDPSLIDSKGRVDSKVHLTHVVRRLKRHVKITHPETGEQVGFPEREVVPIAVLADRTQDVSFIALQRHLLQFIVPELKHSLRTRRFDDALAFLALLKRSTSTVQALTGTLRAVLARYEDLSTTAVEEQESRRQRRRSLKSLQQRLARYGTLTLDEEAEQEVLEIEELAQQLRLLERDVERGQRLLHRTQSIAAELHSLLVTADQSSDPKLNALVEEIRQIRAAEPQANILIYTEYVSSLEAVSARLKAEAFSSILTIQGGDDRGARESTTQKFRGRDGQILVSTDAAAEGLNLHDRCHHLIHLELPWNPNRLEQRNGRIDRYGQWQTPIIRYLYLCGTFEERILARLLAKYERQRHRLHFVPNTLGVALTNLPEAGLFAALSAEADTIGQDKCVGVRFTGEVVDEVIDEAEVRDLLAEVDKSLRHFEQAAQTHRWLSTEGAAADELARQQAQHALDIGRKASQIDLLNFVTQAVQAEGGRVQSQVGTLTLFLPDIWRHGLKDIPGWQPDKGWLQVTTDLNCFTDAQGQPVGFLGRAHPVVRRAIEHVRHQALGQAAGLDRRVSAAKSPDGQTALLITYLGRVNSRVGREFEQVLVVKIGPNLPPVPLTDVAKWLPRPDDALPTKELWTRQFAAWGDAAITQADEAARVAFAELSQKMAVQFRQQLEQERRDLNTWFKQRVDDLVGRVTATALPLFEGLGPVDETPAVRLADFITQHTTTSRERTEAEALQETYQRRLAHIEARLDLQPAQVSQLGLLMLVGET